MPLNHIAFVREDDAPRLPPPVEAAGLVGWGRRNLLSSPFNIIATLLSLLLLAWVLPPLIRWAIVDAAWVGDNREACAQPGAGACWAYVWAKLPQFLFGRYPADERWRVIIVFAMLAAGLLALAIPRVPFKRQTAVFLLVVFPVVALILLSGGNFNVSPRLVWTIVVFGCMAGAVIGLLNAGPGLSMAAGIAGTGFALVAALVGLATIFVDEPVVPILGGIGALDLAALVAAGLALILGAIAAFTAPGRPGVGPLLTTFAIIAGLLLVLALVGFDFGLTFVETPLWGGLLVTLVVAITGMVVSLPLGVLLALGRRSNLPVIRFVSVGFIEFWRGVPLITVLFMASVMLPIFLPKDVSFDKLLRALIGVALFASAYMAEVIRGGLQAVPRGQYEGAMALGLSYWLRMRRIVLPQALTLVIPGIVNSFIALFKDTSLVLIIGIFDLLGIIQSNNADANWASPHTPATGYAFAALVYWTFCFSMSRYSLYTERRLATGYRRRR